MMKFVSAQLRYPKAVKTDDDSGDLFVVWSNKSGRIQILRRWSCLAFFATTTVDEPVNSIS